MNRFIKLNRSISRFFPILVCLCFLGAGVFGQETKEVARAPVSSIQTKPPVPLSVIMAALTDKVMRDGVEVPLTTADRNRIVTDGVRGRGVAFLLTPQVQERLTEAGATPATIEIIRRESAKLRGDEIKIHNISVRYKDLGDAARAAQNFAEAIDNYNQAIELNEKSTFAFIGRGQTYNAMARKFHDQKNYEEENKHYDLAIADFTKIIEIDSTHIGGWYNRALCHYEKFTNNNLTETRINADKAIADLNRVLELNPKYRDAFESRAMVYRYRLGDKEKALQDYQKCQELNGCKGEDIRRYMAATP